MSSDEPENNKNATGSSLRKRLVLLAVVLAVGAAIYIPLRDVLTLDALAKHEGRLRELQQSQPALAYGAALLVYIAVTGLSLPGATVLTLLYGWLFGLVRGVVLVSVASTAGATLAFLFSRYFFRDAVRSRFEGRLAKFKDALNREGPYYLFTLRLIPAVPFFVINAVMGLTRIRTVTFWWVSQLGMLPGTAVYVYAGSSVPNLDELARDGARAAFSGTQLAQLLVAFALLGVFPLAARWLLKRFGGASSLQTSPNTKGQES